MADYWKSTPKYWCKHCSTYVADTKLARANHDATGKHQGAVRRALRNLHRDHERQEREQEKAKREIARLNGIVGGSPDRLGQSSSSSSAPRPPLPPPQQQPSGSGPPRQQLEQLADLGVSIPEELRGDLAMVGDWSVTTVRVVEDAEEDADRNDKGNDKSSVAVGVRKRRLDPESERDEEGGVYANKSAATHDAAAEVDKAVQGLFKKTKRWGRDSRVLPSGSGDVDLDDLLSNALVKKEAKAEEVKKEADDAEEIKKEEADDAEQVKKEEGDSTEAGPKVKTEEDGEEQPPLSKVETAAVLGERNIAGASADDAVAPAGLFKKRKTKNVRHK